MAAANRTHGPIVIVARAHSGTRLLAEALLEAGVYLGPTLLPGFLDSLDCFHRFVLPLVASKHFPDLATGLHSRKVRSLCNHCVTRTLTRFFPRRLVPEYWGWKVSESVFVMPVIKAYFPGARFVHLIRDGRDVVLSDNGYFQLTAPHPEFLGALADLLLDAAGGYVTTKFRAFCLNVTFGTTRLRYWRGIRLTDRRALVRNRFTVQMQSWVHSVATAQRHGRSMGDDYCEVRYEDLCRRPEETVRELFASLNLPLADKAQSFLKRRATTGRIGKWKGAGLIAAEVADFQRAVELGMPLLERLGYMS